MSPLIATPVATFEALPTKILAEVSVVASFALSAVWRSVCEDNVPVIDPQVPPPPDGGI
jgi:hypothetical protein